MGEPRREDARAAVQAAWWAEREATYAMNVAAAWALAGGATRDDLREWTGAPGHQVNHWVALAPSFAAPVTGGSDG